MAHSCSAHKYSYGLCMQLINNKENKAQQMVTSYRSTVIAMLYEVFDIVGVIPTEKGAKTLIVSGYCQLIRTLS